MDKKILEFKDNINHLESTIRKFLDITSYYDLEFEDKHMYDRLYRLQEELDKILNDYNYLENDAEECTLKKLPNERFEVIDFWGKGLKELTCGNKIELHQYDKEDEKYFWSIGVVTHSKEYGGYYFKPLVYGTPISLQEGQKVRIRANS